MEARRPSGLVIGRVAGIPIRLHPTFVALLLVAAAGVLGPAGDMLVWITVVFGSVVAHEVSHSVVARAHGVGVRDILLLPIGGLSELERSPSRPADELAIAVAGPAASLLLAALAALACLAGSTPLLPIDLAGGSLLHRLAWANLFLAGFNLLPAFPMDGGRVLRSSLARRMPPDAATAIAARIGRALAVGLGVVGVLADPWLVFVAVFVYVGSLFEEAASRVSGPR